MRWSSVLAMAVLTAYSAHPAFTVLLQVIDETTQWVGAHFATLTLAWLGLVFVAAVLALRRIPTVMERVEAACRWSGVLLLLTLPVLVSMVWVQAAAESGADQGGAAAAFFLLLIFGGYYAILGVVLLGAATLLRRKRRAAKA